MALPRQDPLDELPPRFKELESLLQRMPVTLSSGEPGLLGTGGFGDAVNKELPLYDVKDITDSRLLMALFRDYTFAASAYLLEPCDIVHRKRREFGPERSLPFKEYCSTSSTGCRQNWRQTVYGIRSIVCAL